MTSTFRSAPEYTSYTHPRSTTHDPFYLSDSSFTYHFASPGGSSDPSHDSKPVKTSKYKDKLIILNSGISQRLCYDIECVAPIMQVARP